MLFVSHERFLVREVLYMSISMNIGIDRMTYSCIMGILRVLCILVHQFCSNYYA